MFDVVGGETTKFIMNYLLTVDTNMMRNPQNMGTV